MMANQSPTPAEIIRLFGAIDDHKVVEIMALNPSPDDLEITEAYLAGIDDVMGKEHHPLIGTAAKIYEIVTRDEIPGDEDYPRPEG